MAMSYQNFASLGVNLNRQKYGPLDISNVFTSAADLKYYLTKGTFTEGVSEYWYKNANEKIVPYPYEGQVLATVIDGVVEVFVLALDANGNFETREIAGKIEVDGTTIVKDAEGKLSIVAPVEPDSTKTYNFSYANGVYSWVAVDTATAAGQAQKIEELTNRTVALEDTVNGKPESAEGAGDAVVGLVDKVDTNAANIAAIDSRLGAAAEGDAAATGVYAAIDQALADAKEYANSAYDDTALVGRVETLETASGDHESRLAEVEKFFAVTGEDKISEALDTLVELQKEIAEDNAGAAAMLSSIEANTEAIAVLNGDITKAGSVDKKIADAIAAENLSQYATTEALAGVSEDVANLENELLAYAKTSEVGSELAKKIESATITHAVAANEAEGIVAVPEGVTKEGTVLKIVVDAPTRAETTQMIADKVAQVTGGESAAAVKLSLEAEVERSTAKDEAHDTALAKLNGEATVSGSVAEAKARADQGVADAAAVAADLVTANAAIEENTREIDVAKNQISTVNTTLSEKITTLENKDTTIESNITSLQTVVSGEGGHASRIASLETSTSTLASEDARLAALIQDNTDKFANYSDTTAMNKAIDDKIAAIKPVDLSAYAKTEDVNSAIQTVNAEVATKANAADVYDKDAADAKFMTQDQVDARLNTLIDGANSEDTITNVTNLVAFVNDNAGDIAKLVTDVATNKAAHEKNATDISTNAAAIAAINASLAAIVSPKASDEISVATDGTLGIKGLSINKLVQTEDDILILNGGSAAAKAVSEAQ